MAFKTMVVQYNHLEGISVNIDCGTLAHEPKKLKIAKKSISETVFVFSPAKQTNSHDTGLQSAPFAVSPLRSSSR